jgi:RNA polymerase-binding transcription factor DksA
MNLDLETVVARLRAELARFEARGSRTSAHLRRETEPLPADWEERGSALADDDVVEALDAAAHGRIVELRGALGRIEAGEFGRCATCENEIAPERLLVLPSTRVCIRCVP